jgi:choline dehydrogenase-like flavoprotein
LEAGVRGDDKSLHVDGQRWNTFLNKEVNWGYKTVPQENCNGRQMDYSQGRVLGGSTAINFSVFTVGSRDDYDEWATIVGDELYKWDRMQPRFRRLEAAIAQSRSRRTQNMLVRNLQIMDPKALCE